MRTRTRAARLKSWSARTFFLHVSFYAYECCMAKLKWCATKNFCAVITFTEIFAPLFYSHVEVPITLQTLMTFAIYQDEM